MKEFIGSANIDTNLRLCMSLNITGHQRTFGGDPVPSCCEDLEQAELVVFASHAVRILVGHI
jgi:assimilatory nitrate reductase catalytic subunit